MWLVIIQLNIQMIYMSRSFVMFILQVTKGDHGDVT